MAYQKLFLTSYVEDLKSRLRNGDLIKIYSADKFVYEESAVRENPRLETEGQVKLILPEDALHHDFENSRIVFEFYKKMTLVMATDVRIWAYLTHCDFWEYMKKRWPLNKSGDSSLEKNVNYVTEHWFVKSPVPTWLLRNGVSRLWWVAYLTYDETRRDPYELTREAFSMLDYTRHLLQEIQGRYENFRYGLLEFVIENKDLFANYKEGRVRFLMRKVNYLGGYKIFCNMSKEKIKEIFSNYRQEIEGVTSTSTENED